MHGKGNKGASRALLIALSFGMGKLIAYDMKVSVNGAGAHYREVESNQDIDAIVVGGARSNGRQQRPDPSSNTWELTLSGPVEEDFSGSFHEVCEPGAIVTILSVSGLAMAKLTGAGPWFVKPKSLRWAMGEAVIERITIVASYGGMVVPAATTLSYPDPDTLT